MPLSLEITQVAQREVNAEICDIKQHLPMGEAQLGALLGIMYPLVIFP